MAAKPDNWLQTRTSLLNRLKDLDDQSSWQSFFDSYSKLLYSVALKSGFSAPEAEDLVQDTVIAVAKHLPGFEYDPARGSFKGWLMSILRHRMIDRVRQRNRRPVMVEDGTSDRSTALIHRIPDPALPDLDRIWDEQWDQHLLNVAMDRVREAATPRDFQIFDCLVLKEWPVDQVVAALQVNKARVYVAKSRVASLLRKEVERLQARCP